MDDTTEDKPRQPTSATDVTQSDSGEELLTGEGFDVRSVLIKDLLDAQAELEALVMPPAMSKYQGRREVLLDRIGTDLKHLRDLVNRFGEYVDEATAHKAFMDQRLTWDIDADRWLALAPEGSNRRRALEELVDKTVSLKAVQRAVKEGIVSEMELDANKVRRHRVHSASLKVVPVGQGGGAG